MFCTKSSEVKPKPSWTRSWVKMERIYNCAHAKSKRNRLIVHVK